MLCPCVLARQTGSPLVHPPVREPARAPSAPARACITRTHMAPPLTHPTDCAQRQPLGARRVGGGRDGRERRRRGAPAHPPPRLPAAGACGPRRAAPRHAARLALLPRARVGRARGKAAARRDTESLSSPLLLARLRRPWASPRPSQTPATARTCARACRPTCTTASGAPTCAPRRPAAAAPRPPPRASCVLRARAPQASYNANSCARPPPNPPPVRHVGAVWC